MSIEITLKNYRCFPDDRPATFKVEKGFTAFVGPNNAGKSTILKSFWEFRPLFVMLSRPENFTSLLQGNKINIGFPSTIRDSAEIYCNSNTRNLSIEFGLASVDTSTLPTPLGDIPDKVIVQIERGSTFVELSLFVNNMPVIKDGHIRVVQQGENILLYHSNTLIADLTLFRTVFEKLSQFLYIPAYRNAINVGGQEGYFDIQVGQIFINQWRSWQAGGSQANRKAALNLVNLVADIFGYEHLDVQVADNNETLVLNIDKLISQTLPELGSGIAQFFMVLGNIAVKNPPFVLIDEPELNLHPSLQSAFLECIAKYTKEGVIFSTHNLGLALKQTNSIYSVQRIARGHSELHLYEKTPRLPEFLGELSFAGYRELGFDKVLLVEGVTDLRAIQHFLSLYGKQNKIVLVPLGGNTLIDGRRREELEEVRRICPKVSAIIDSEKTSESDSISHLHAAFKNTCANLSPSIECKILNRRALENYFTDSAIKAVLGPKYSDLGEFGKAEWNKNENWRIAQKMTLADIEETDLGQFLAAL